MPFFILFLIPAVVGMIAFRLLPGITWKEFALQMAAQAVVAGLFVAVIYTANTSDTEVLHGVVTGKERKTISCQHSYPCRCQTSCSGSGRRRSCRKVCSTCYEHSVDYDWRLDSSLEITTSVDRVAGDRQGVHEPPRWTVARVGEPFAVEHSYTNYIKAAPGSLFRRQGLIDKYAGKLPAYPDRVYDLYRHDALVLVNGARVSDPRAWNQRLAEINARLGPSKRVDVTLVLVRDLPQEYFYALEQAWIGGKKNSVVLVIGVNEALAPQWATVMSWSKSEWLKVYLRGSVMELPTLERDLLLRILELEVLVDFEHRSMKDFEYLASSIAPTTTEWILGMVLGLLVCLGLTWAFHRYDVFGDEGFTRLGNNRRDR